MESTRGKNGGETRVGQKNTMWVVHCIEWLWPSGCNELEIDARFASRVRLLRVAAKRMAIPTVVVIIIDELGGTAEERRSVRWEGI